MEYEMKNGTKYEISYSQVLQQRQINILRQVKMVGIIGIVLLVISIIFLGIIIFTDVMATTIRSVVC